jgi:hypothetical protein
MIMNHEYFSYFSHSEQWENRSITTNKMTMMKRQTGMIGLQKWKINTSANMAKVTNLHTNIKNTRRNIRKIN